MRKIDEKDYCSYTIHIDSNGCNVTLNSLSGALKEWAHIKSGILYGNKPNGDKAIIDSRGNR